MEKNRGLTSRIAANSTITNGSSKTNPKPRSTCVAKPKYSPAVMNGSKAVPMKRSLNMILRIAGSTQRKAIHTPEINNPKPASMAGMTMRRSRS